MNYIKKYKKTFIQILFIYLLFLISIFILYNYKELYKPFEYLKDRIYYTKNFKTKNLNFFLDENISNDIYNELIKDNENLKILLNLKNTYTYKLIPSLIVSKDRFMFNTFTIDKGYIDGVKEGNAVISTTGLIGEVINTTKNYSEVISIYSNNYTKKLSIKINGYYGVISNIDEEGYIYIEGIKDLNEIKKGDDVKTSSLSTVFKEDIFIGSVEEIIKDKYGIKRIVKAKNEMDYDNLKYVLVVY